MGDVCQHPFDRLRVDSGRSGQRGQSSTYKVMCDACDKPFPGSLGIARLLQSAIVDNEAIWTAVRGLGGRRRDMLAPKARGENRQVDKGECAHYMAWLFVDAGGAGTRGYSGTIWIRCRGCKSKWTEAVGLGVFLKRLVEERREIVDTIRRLGGSVE
jgi:hypothetical protein